MALNNDFLIPIESDKQISKIPTFLLDVSGLLVIILKKMKL